MDNEIYWLWLQGVLGYGRSVKELIEFFGDARAIYETDRAELRNSRIKALTSGVITKMLDEDIEKYYETFDFCKKHNIHLITPDSEYYPPELLKIDNYPLVLYVRGDYTCLNSKNTIAVIGSRTPSKYGEEATKEIVKGLCEKDYIIVSGGALGIDSIAHSSAIENKGKTILVMGCGHGSGYLPENGKLRKRVVSNGALVTEYPPYSNVTQATFPMRNRIISGISKGVVIVEAAQYSGTFSTARHSMIQGRDLFVLPGDIKSGNYAGSNQLIVEGATPIFSAEDILSAKDKKHSLLSVKNGKPFEGILAEASSYKRRKSSKKVSIKTKEEKIEEKTEKNPQEKQKINMETISKNAGIVYNIMSDGINDFDEIVRLSLLQVRYVMTALTELEMKGIVLKTGSGQYCLK